MLFFLNSRRKEKKKELLSFTVFFSFVPSCVCVERLLSLLFRPSQLPSPWRTSFFFALSFFFLFLFSQPSFFFLVHTHTHRFFFAFERERVTFCLPFYFVIDRGAVFTHPSPVGRLGEQRTSVLMLVYTFVFFCVLFFRCLRAFFLCYFSADWRPLKMEKTPRCQTTIRKTPRKNYW